MDLHFELIGSSPLLLHADDIDAQDRRKAWSCDPDNANFVTPGDDRTPPWTWHGCLYHDGNNLTMPSANVMANLMKAGKRIILPGPNKKKTYKELTQIGIIPHDEHFELLVNGKVIPLSEINKLEKLSFSEQAEAVKNLGFLLFTKRATIGRAKHVRVRPRFPVWSVRGKLEIDAEELTPEVLETLFTIAGRLGLGDWTPGTRTPGPYGQYKVYDEKGKLLLKFVK